MWPKFVAQFGKELEKKTKGEVVKWLTPSFSTTTPLDVTVCQISIMNTLKSYFSYGMQILCGLPSVTLEGTLQDWEILIEKAKKLYEYVLKDWADLLIPVLERF